MLSTKRLHVPVPPVKVTLEGGRGGLVQKSYEWEKQLLTAEFPSGAWQATLMNRGADNFMHRCCVDKW